MGKSASRAALRRYGGSPEFFDSAKTRSRHQVAKLVCAVLLLLVFLRAMSVRFAFGASMTHICVVTVRLSFQNWDFFFFFSQTTSMIRLAIQRGYSVQQRMLNEDEVSFSLLLSKAE